MVHCGPPVDNSNQQEMADSGLTGSAALLENVQSHDCCQRNLSLTLMPSNKYWLPGRDVNVNVLTG
jgi:hypothetical protein